MSKAKRPDYLRALKDPEDNAAQLGLPGVEPAPEYKPDQPKGLSELELAVWDELLQEIPEQARKDLNRLVFETLVRATVQYRDAADKVTTYGAVIKSPSGYPIQSPYESIMNKKAALIRMLSAELGLTHRSRQGAKKQGTKPGASNPFAGLKTLE